METSIDSGSAVRELPPLTLHPSNKRASPSDLLGNSKTALILSGLMLKDGTEPDELRRRLLVGRYSEVRMLFFLGRDVCRWMGSAGKGASRRPERENRRWRNRASRDAGGKSPCGVREKLLRWGVADYRSIFVRAIGLNCSIAPPLAILPKGFVHNYHR